MHVFGLWGYGGKPTETQAGHANSIEMFFLLWGDNANHYNNLLSFTNHFYVYPRNGIWSRLPCSVSEWKSIVCFPV